jgi:O-antigen/teichoic acid export membrane protein
MIATVFLARLLSATDFGLVAMVTTFSLLLMNFGFNGFTEAVVQREEIDHALASNLFWINLGVGLLLTIAFAGAGSGLARLYGDPRIASVTVVMSATIFLTSISVLHLALLKRDLQFMVLSCNDVVARAASVAVSIALGWAAWGYWALVAGAVALPLVTSIGAFAGCRWVPGLPRRHRDTGPAVRFALNTYGYFAVNYCTRNLDNLLVGWFFGPSSLGFYKKAYDLCVLPVAQLSGPLHAVAMPVLSRLSNDEERLHRYILRAMSTLAFIGMGLGVWLAVIGKDLTLIVLGPRWEESGRIFTFFAPGVGALLLYLTYGWIHISIGRADRLFRWALIEFAVIGCLFVVALPWGPIGIATAWVMASWILVIPALQYAGRPARLRIAPIVGVVWKYVLSSAIAGGASAAIVRAVPALMAAPGWVGALDRIVAASLSFGIFYLAAVIFLHRGWAPLHLVGSFLPDLFPQGFPGASAADRATPDAGPRRPSIVGGQVSTQRAN